MSDITVLFTTLVKIPQHSWPRKIYLFPEYPGFYTPTRTLEMHPDHVYSIWYKLNVLMIFYFNCINLFWVSRLTAALWVTFHTRHSNPQVDQLEHSVWVYRMVTHLTMHAGQHNKQDWALINKIKVCIVIIL